MVKHDDTGNSIVNIEEYNEMVELLLKSNENNKEDELSIDKVDKLFEV